VGKGVRLRGLARNSGLDLHSKAAKTDTAMLLSLSLSLLISATPGSEPHPESQAGPVVERWAGHQVALGEKYFPVVGSQKTRIDTYTLATVQYKAGRLILKEQACKVEYAEVMGAKVHVPVEALPISTLEFEKVAGSEHYAMESLVQWGREDIDHDGEPGMTVVVDAPVCSGKIQVSNRTVTHARAFRDRGRFHGRVNLTVYQQVFGADSFCLQRLSKASKEVKHGHFAYVRVDPSTRCKDLIGHPWPVRADQ